MDEKAIEAEIQSKGLNAARLSPAQIDDAIKSHSFYRFPNTVVTVCCITLKNGFNVIGQSAPVSAANFNEEIGNKIAFEDARSKIWQLEGYLLREKLHISGKE